MSSLHTRYRPTSFKEMIGQSAITRSLERVIKDGRAHTFLFCGPAGTGKTTLARLLAATFGAAGSNLYEYDGASKSGADDMRQLVSNLYYKAVGLTPIKFVIIDECHKLSSAAWDVLLKPTEEPPSHVYYAFCTTNVGKVPKAIITRCLKYDLKPLKEDDILDLLCRVIDAEKLNINEEIIEIIAEESTGSPRQALVYLEACAGVRNASEAREIIKTAGFQKEIVDLARWLVSGQKRTWAEAMRLIKGLEGQEAETIRIVLQNYFAAVLLNTKKETSAIPILGLIEAFSRPYIQSDKLAPLLHSIGIALGLDR